MANPGFSKGGGDEQYTWEGLPNAQSTNPVDGADRRVNQWRGQHEQGPVVFRYVKLAKERWLISLSPMRRGRYWEPIMLPASMAWRSLLNFGHSGPLRQTIGL